MEQDLFAGGALSDDEFRQLVRRAYRYLYWDVDQFDHWRVPYPTGGYGHVDFNQGGPTPYGDESYRMVTPEQ